MTDRKPGLVVHGTIRVPGDKSISHRSLMLAALAEGESRVRGILESADTLSTAAALRSLGCEITPLGAELTIKGRGVGSLRSPDTFLDCGNSGTTARLLIGVVAGSDGVNARFDGDASLRRRPMRRISDPLSQMGARFVFEPGSEGRLPLEVRGTRLFGMSYRSEQASAQVKSAILLAGLCSGVEVSVQEPARSRDHTERMLAARGVSIDVLAGGVRLHSGQRLSPGDSEVPADPSSAAFFAALAALADSGSILLENVCLNPTRTGFFEALVSMGGEVEYLSGRTSGGEPVGDVLVRPSALKGITVSGEIVPRAIDELPLLACLAVRAEGETRIVDAAELRVKESDRIGAVVANLRALGVSVEELPDGMVVQGTEKLLNGHVVTHGDHRLAMAFGVLAACPGNNITIDAPDCVAVSFPTFWSELRRVTGSSTSGVAGHSGNPGEAPPRMVIAIDGPAASGKSSTAKWVASELGYRHIDSGALYRAITLLAIESAGNGEPNLSPEHLLEVGRGISLQLRDMEAIPVAGERVLGEELRSNAVTALVSRVAAIPEVRQWVNSVVRETAARADVVIDGRDIGTAVFPDASLKIFLEADPWERARRRRRQRFPGREPTEAEIADETEVLVARDARDATQSVPARDAITINTTDLRPAEQVERIVALALAARRRLGGGGGLEPVEA